MDRVTATAAPAATVAPEPAAPQAAEASAAGVSRELQIAVARAALATGDAPGTDSSIAPRPAESTRLLDTTLDASGSRLRAYSTRLAASAVRPEIARGIVASGYHPTDLSDDPDTASFQRGQSFVVVRYSSREDRTLVSIVEFGFRSARGED